MGGHFDIESKQKRIEELEQETLKEDFWQDIKKSNEVNKELSSLKKIISKLAKLTTEIKDNIELIPLLNNEELSTVEDEL